MHPIAILGAIALVLVLILLLKRWVGEPGRTLIRYQMIAVLWAERERIRGTIATQHITHWESVQLRDRLFEIDADLHRLGVPWENLQ